MATNLDDYRARRAQRAIEEAALPAFERFWRACPKKVGKLLAQQKWDAITSPMGLHTKMLDRTSGQFIAVHLKASADELIAAMKTYAQTQYTKDFTLIDGGRFTLHPASWLNTGRWLD